VCVVSCCVNQPFTHIHTHTNAPFGSVPCLTTVEKSLSSRGFGLSLPHRPQLFDEFFLLLAEVLWNVDLDGDVVIPSLVGVAQSGSTVALQSHDLSGLRTGRDLDGHLAIDDRRLDGVSENGVDVADGFLRVDLGSLATELGILLDAQENVQVSGGTAVGTGVSLSSHPELVAVLDSGGNGDLDLFRLLVESLSAAGSAVFLDLLSGSATAGAGLLRLEVSERGSGHLDRDSAAAAVGAGADLAAGLDTASATGVAGLQVANADLFLSSKDGGLEVDLQIESEIVSDHGSSGLLSGTGTSSSSKAATAAKEGIKNIVQVDLLSETGTTSKGRSLALTGRRGSHTRFPKHVVFLFQVRVFQNLVGTVDLLELFRGVLSGVGIWMELLGLLSKSGFDFLRRCVSADSKDSVKITSGLLSGRHEQRGAAGAGAASFIGSDSGPFGRKSGGGALLSDASAGSKGADLASDRGEAQERRNGKGWNVNHGV